jgi:hypothetical protein
MPIVGSFAGASARAYGLGAGGVGIGDFESIQTITAGSAVASVAFTSIPSTYTHLQVRGISRSTEAVSSLNWIAMTINSTNLSYAHELRGDGSSTSSGSFSSAPNVNWFGLQPTANMTANAFGCFVMDILDYANTNKFKTVRTIFGSDTNGAGAAQLTSAYYGSTSAITSLTFSARDANLAQYSSFALYGVKA